MYMKYFFFTIDNGIIASNDPAPAGSPDMYELSEDNGKESIYYIIINGCIANIMCEAVSLAGATKAVELFLSFPSMGNNKK
jgi:hypothetical protein